MSTQAVLALLPLLVPGSAVVILLLGLAVRRHHAATFGFTLLALAASIGVLFPARFWGAGRVGQLFVFDDFALFFMALLFAGCGAVVLLARGYLTSLRSRCEEHYLLLLLATLGAAALVAARHFASFFLGLELMSVSLYALIAFLPSRRRSIEAGFKYLVLAAVSSAFLLFGMALVYARTGTLEFVQLGGLLGSCGTDSLGTTGLVLMLVGIGFKLALAPFHMWTPDVYQGAPAPVTAFVATVSKGAVMALLVRLFAGCHGWDRPGWLLVFGVLAIASMFTGNLLAMFQTSLKRLLACSSIAHLGYLLVALVAGGKGAVDVVAFYLVAYFLTTLGAFGVVGALSGPDGEADDLVDYRGLARRRPFLALVLTATLLSLAGIPLTAGFLGKFLVLASGVSAGLTALVVILAVNSVLGLFYYLRVVVVMFMNQAAAPVPEDAEPVRRPAWSTGFLLGVLLLLLLAAGIYPAPLFWAIHRASSCLF